MGCIGCCGKDEKDKPFAGPNNKDRGCTDILCCLIFCAFVICLMLLMGYALIHGDINRVLNGWDVAGNVCGQDNDKINDIARSGLNMENKPYLEFDLVRTVEIQGENALKQFAASTQKSISEAGFEYNVSMGTNDEKIDSCLGYTSSSRRKRSLFLGPNSFQIIKEDQPPESGHIILSQPEDLHKAQLISAEDAIDVVTDSEHHTSYRLYANGSVAIVYRKAKADSEDSDAQSVEDQVKDEAKEQADAALTDAGDMIIETLLQDPIQNIISGGGTCRRCVKKCPENTKPYLSRCLPDVAEKTASTFYSASGMASIMDNIINDISISWVEICYMAGIALGFSIIVTLLFRVLAGLIIYFILFLIILACLGGTALLWVMWYFKDDYYDTNKSKEVTVSEAIEDRMFQAETQGEVDGYLAAAIIASIFTLIILIILLVLRKRITFVVALFKEAGAAVAAMPLILLQPLLTFLALIVCVACWTVGILILESSGTATQMKTTGFVIYEKDSYLLAGRFMYIFGIFWLTQFIIACQHIVVAGTFATWYFTRDKSRLGFPILKSMWNMVRYHIGSAAFGSFIIALIKFIRMIIAYLERKMKKHNKYACCRGMLKCCGCVLWCFEKLLKFISRNAYIEVAISGHYFCKAAKEAFKHITEHILKVAAINSVGAFVLFLGKLSIIVGTVVSGYYIIKSKDPGDNMEAVQYIWVPCALGGLIAYLIADTFISIYSMAIDTIFLCYCEDLHYNNGTDKPYFAQQRLWKYMDGVNKETLKQAQANAIAPAPAMAPVQQEPMMYPPQTPHEQAGAPVPPVYQ